MSLTQKEFFLFQLIRDFKLEISNIKPLNPNHSTTPKRYNKHPHLFTSHHNSQAFKWYIQLFTSYQILLYIDMDIQQIFHNNLIIFLNGFFKTSYIKFLNLFSKLNTCHDAISIFKLSLFNFNFEYHFKKILLNSCSNVQLILFV